MGPKETTFLKRNEKKVDKRKEPRLKIRVKVKLVLPLGETEEKLEEKKDEVWAFTQEISAGGLRLILPFTLEKNQKIPLDIYLASDKVLKVIAEVRWQRRSLISGLYETGFEFSFMPPEERITLMEFLYLKKSKKFGD